MGEPSVMLQSSPRVGDHWILLIHIASTSVIIDKPWQEANHFDASSNYNKQLSSSSCVTWITVASWFVRTNFGGGKEGGGQNGTSSLPPYFHQFGFFSSVEKYYRQQYTVKPIPYACQSRGSWIDGILLLVKIKRNGLGSCSGCAIQQGVVIERTTQVLPNYLQERHCHCYLKERTMYSTR